MSREIKFRGWHVATRTMTYDPLAITDKGSSEHLNNCFSEETQRWQILMAWTGLKDKNGKEIYEGDIVFARDETDHRRNRYYIHYQDKRAEWQLGNKTDWGVTAMHYIDQETIEVIGNIYENPELLTVKEKE